MKVYIQLALILMLVPFLTIVGLSISHYVTSKNLLTERGISEVVTIAEGKHEQVMQFITLTYNYLDLFLANSDIVEVAEFNQEPELIEGKKKRLQEIFGKVRNEREEFMDIILLDNFGRVILRSNQNSPLGEDFSHTSYFLEGRLHNYLSDVRKSDYNSSENFFVLSSPIEEHGRPVGVIMIIVSTDNLDRMMAFRNSIPESESYLVNKYGAMITSSIYDKHVVLNRVVRTEAYRQCQDEGRFSGIYTSYVGKKVVGASKLIRQTGWCVIVEIQEQKALAAVSSLKYQTVLIFFISITLVIIVSFFVSNFQFRVLDHMKDEFLNITSHELKTPLTPIMGLLKMLLDKPKKFKLGKEVREHLCVCCRNAIRLNVLVNDILDFTKLKSKRMKFYMEKLDFEKVIRESVKDVQPLAEEKNVKIIHKAEKLPLIIGDENRLLQVLNNMLNNSLKFTDKGSITIKSSSSKKFVRVDIADTGIGIDKENLSKLFTKFFQIQESTTRKTGGTGLGLAICKEIIHEHKGRIWAESAGIGKGSTFSFILPIAKKQVP